MFVDSIDKIVTSYLRAVTSQRIEYKTFVFEPSVLRVSPMIFRGYTCPPMCGGCCPRFSLDYLPEQGGFLSQKARERLVRREVVLNGKSIEIYSDLQTDHTDHYCRHLNKENGRCGIHGHQPFSCDFEIIRTSISDVRPNQLSTRLFGRGWAFLRVDGKRGALCEIQPVTEESKQDTLRKIKRLKEWADHFKVETCLDGIIEYIRSGPHEVPAFFNTHLKEVQNEPRRVRLVE